VSYLKGTKTNTQKSADPIMKTEPYGFSGYDFFVDSRGIPAIKPPFGTLTAIDLNSAEILWQVPLGEDSVLRAIGIPQSGMYSRGGGIATAGGLVFIGATGDGKFRAFNQQTGKIEWEKQLPGQAYSMPSTYSIGKRQFITVAVSPNPSNGFKGGYVTYGLDR
jgi:quinoprotein glucose dehydrogenase